MKQRPGIYMTMTKSETVKYLRHHYLIYGVIERSMRCKYHEVHRSGHSSWNVVPSVLSWFTPTLAFGYVFLTVFKNPTSRRRFPV